MIIALMYYEGDLEVAMELARLLTDIEPRPRTDVRLALVCQPGTPRTPLVAWTVRHCRRRFEVDEVVSPLGATGWPVACTALWFGACSYYHNLFAKGELGKHRCIFTVDANDAAPLHSDWISMMLQLHEDGRRENKLVMGTPYFIDRCPLHLNPNAIFDFELFDKTPLLSDLPRYDGTQLTHFDIYHRKLMIDNASLSSVVRTDWHGAGEKASLPLLFDRSREAIWLHGYKDEDFRWKVREHLSHNPSPPRIAHYDLDQISKHTLTQRYYEEAYL